MNNTEFGTTTELGIEMADKMEMVEAGIESVLVPLYFIVGFFVFVFDLFCGGRLMNFIGEPSVGHGFLIFFWPLIFLMPKPKNRYRWE